MTAASENANQHGMLASQRTKKAKEDSSRASYFPLGYKSAAYQWWSSITPAVAERKVLSFIPFIQELSKSSSTDPSLASTESNEDKSKSENDPYGPRAWHSNLVNLSGKDRILNEFSVERIGEDIEQNLVMLHGYGAGLGFFYKNFEGLSRVKGWKIYALDMLGMGRSSRPPFRINAKDQAGKISEAEDWFIDSLEEWRRLRNINKFTLLGHSMGGYMAVAYALKYPGRLNKLILASPVGLPEDPNATQAELPEPKYSTLSQEFNQSQDETTTHQDQSTKNTNETSPRRVLPKWLVYLWDANISPFSFVRWTGPLGPRFVSGWTSRRFSHLPACESEALHHYAYSVFRQRGSGEYALAYILAPGAFARSPLIRRIHKVGRQELPSSNNPCSSSSTSQASKSINKETGIPIVMMYGENDWMDIAGGFAAEEKIREEKEKALREANEEERLKENGSTKVLTIKNSGHHLYLDGWEEFNEIMRNEMEETKMHEKAVMNPS